MDNNENNITLSCGMVVRWEREDAFKHDKLMVVNDICECQCCGNPWNHMTDQESTYIKSLRNVKKEIPGGLQVLLQTETFATADDMEDDMKETLGADCWGVFTTSADRRVVHHIFFNFRSGKTKEAEKAREILMDDTLPLIDWVQRGQTVVFIMGGRQFMDIYYSKIGDILLKNVIDHTLSW
jgi:hypothetical protein